MTLVKDVDPIAFEEFLKRLRENQDPQDARNVVAIIERTTALLIDFDTCFDRLMKNEGGYSNDINDPGGETNWGISKRAYPLLNIRTLTREEAKEIYRKDFWEKINADKLPGAVAFHTFDFAVNSGISTAIRHLQKVVNVADDGFWGPVSQAAADAMSTTDLIMRLNAERLDFMRKLSNWKYHGKGWAGRIAANLRYGATDS